MHLHNYHHHVYIYLWSSSANVPYSNRSRKHKHYHHNQTKQYKEAKLKACAQLRTIILEHLYTEKEYRTGSRNTGTGDTSYAIHTQEQR